MAVLGVVVKKIQRKSLQGFFEDGAFGFDSQQGIFLLQGVL
jgi:hypothetical protein